MKTCTQCHETKPIDGFSPNKTGKDGRHTWCRACKTASARYWHAQHREDRKAYDSEKYAANGDRARTQARAWHATHLERSRENKRKWKLALHGLTDAQRAAIYTEQGGKCAVCRKPALPADLRVDHCHATQRVRGLLCHHCNVGIGHFFDAPELFRAAADYVERAAVKRTA